MCIRDRRKSDVSPLEVMTPRVGTRARPRMMMSRASTGGARDISATTRQSCRGVTSLMMSSCRVASAPRAATALESDVSPPGALMSRSCTRAITHAVTCARTRCDCALRARRHRGVAPASCNLPHVRGRGGCERAVRTVTGFCARAVGCSCPWGARARYPSVPTPCSRPSVGPTRSLLVAAVCSYSSNYSFLGVLLLAGYPYPLCAPTRSLPAPARCPCLLTARACCVPVPLLLRLLGRALAPAPPRDLARAPWRAARARPLSKKAKSY